jgi:hypothetical protein
MVHVRVGWIDEHHAHHLFAMTRGEHADVERAVLEPNEDVRTRNCSPGEEAIQFVGNIRAGAWLIGRVAPAKTSTIVGTNTSKFVDLGLNQLPNN